MLKVLVVDDSAFVRRSLIRIIEANQDIKVVASASNGEEAIARTKEFDPDVITMDVEMPRMNGLVAVERIMKEAPCPIIMVSSLTSEGADITLRALELGALDFMPKLNSSSLPDMQRLEAELGTRIRALARRKAFMRLKFNRGKDSAPPPRPGMPARPASPSSLGQAAGAARPATARPGAAPVPGSAPHTASLIERATAAVRPPGYPLGIRPFEAVAIGVSTGGPPAVQKVLSQLPASFPVPVLIAQHMPAAFTGPFAARLDAQCAIHVKEAEPIERAKNGTVYICPGGKHIRLENRGGTLTIVVTDDPKDALYKPSANVLMETVGTALGKKALCVMLTGMGNDGFEGTKVLKAKGGWAIAQDEASCIVYGMPKAIIDANLADEIVSIDDVAKAIKDHFTGLN
ncbi:chemotaxis response regulator protein-glutamate methylesterase [Desulfovibrio sp. OttesenSCG-928-G15]|nr:chemotaxis response regulator protein-glutamate methylesterase [Desulfovibrio sp. OttesenSCG-928-G15]